MEASNPGPEAVPKSGGLTPKLRPQNPRSRLQSSAQQSPSIPHVRGRGLFRGAGLHGCGGVVIRKGAWSHHRGRGRVRVGGTTGEGGA